MRTTLFAALAVTLLTPDFADAQRWGRGWGGGGSGWGVGYNTGNFGIGYQSGGWGNNWGGYPGYGYGGGWGRGYGWGGYPGYGYGGYGSGLNLGYTDGNFGIGLSTGGYGSGYGSGFYGNSYPSYGGNYGYSYPSGGTGYIDGGTYMGSTMGSTYGTGTYMGSTYGTGAYMGSSDMTQGNVYQAGYGANMANVVRLEIIVPDDSAEITIQGQRVSGSGRHRSFVSPSLEQGKEYTYTIAMRGANTREGGEQTKKIDVKAGSQYTVDFTSGSGERIPAPGGFEADRRRDADATRDRDVNRDRTTDRPNTDRPNTDRPNTDRPNTDRPNTDRPRNDTPPAPGGSEPTPPRG